MTDALYFMLGLITGIGAMASLIVLWGLMNISSLISREEDDVDHRPD
jgi:hypothetical protein